MRIYIDVDDTLAYFRKYAIERGVPAWSGTWYTTPREGWTQEQCAIQDATNTLMERDDFWPNLPVVDGSHELISAAQFVGPTYLLTAMPRGVRPELHDSVKRQKVQWAWQKLHVPPERVLVVPREAKARFAFDHFEGRQNLLIDDAHQNVEEWVAADGEAHWFYHDDHVTMEHAMQDAINFVKCI